MRAVIFANGLLSGLPAIEAAIQKDDLLIAADGGAIHCLNFGLTPRFVVGDFDSLSTETVQTLERLGAKLVVYPVRKDFTDLELALQLAHSQGAEVAVVLGALGNRWDMTLANLLLPAYEAFSALTIRLVDGNQEISLVRAGKTGSFYGEPGDIVSLIPLGGAASGITTNGLEYPLEHGTLEFGSSRGVSNVLIGQQATVELEMGMLLSVIIHKKEEKNV